MPDDSIASAARAQQRALAALARPITQQRGPVYDIGDGDRCPMHGRKMLVIRSANRQHCPDQSHDGVWSKEGHQPRTRAFWPVQYFEAAVAAWRASLASTQESGSSTLPDIDLGGFDL